MTQEELRMAPMRHYIVPLVCNNEEWKKIELFDVRPIYWISTYGRVYNEKTGYIMEGHIVSNGYVVVSFKTIDGKRIYCHVHRVMMLTFCPIPNPELFVVNHIDGVKTHNYIYNLEWVTQQQNVEHAFNMGLRKYGENSSHAIFTNAQVHHVCKCMEDGLNLIQLSYRVFDREPDQQIQSLCKNIYSGKFWKEISCNYAIENYKGNKIFSVPQIEIICQMLSVDINVDTSIILNALNITDFSKEELIVYNRAIRCIRKGISCKNISQKYNLQYI